MAGDDWKMEAVHAQFDVHDSLINSYFTINQNNFGDLWHVVTNLIRSYSFGNVVSTMPPRIIAAEIMKNSTDNQAIKLSFAVIITDKRERNQLSKFPIFSLMSGNKKLFILATDSNCTLFNNWNSFLNQNDLPPCNLCFPVDGSYSYGGELKVDFGASPALMRHTRIMRHTFWGAIGTVVVSSVSLALSYFFKIPIQDQLNFGKQLVEIAAEFIEPALSSCLRNALSVVEVVRKLWDRRINILTALPQIFRIVKRVYSDFKNEIDYVAQWVKEKMRKVYEYVYNLFTGFQNSSYDSRTDFLALTNQVDTDMSNLERNVKERLNNLSNNTFNSSPQSTAENHSEEIQDSSLYVNRIFQNCRDESTFHLNMKHKCEDLNPKTKDLLNICQKEVNLSSSEKSLYEIKDSFESLSSIVKDEYRDKIKTYFQMVDAAKAAAGHDIDLEIFNASLGIKGDVETHYWHEAIKSCQTPRLSFLIKSKISELHSQKKVFIVPMFDSSEQSQVFDLYKIVGVSGAGKISISNVVEVLQGTCHALNDEYKYIDNEGEIFIQSPQMFVVVYQELNEENTSHGVLLVNRV